MKKRALCALVSLVLCFTLAGQAAAAESGVSFVVNGVTLETQVPHQVVDGTTYVPLEMFDMLLGNGAVTPEDGKIVIKTGSNDDVQIPSPFIDCSSLAEASQVAGFGVRVPESVGDYDRTSISAIDGELIDILYESGDDTIRVRKGVGTEDISGDYNSYAETAVFQVDGMDVTMKGDCGRVSLAVWTSGEYTYSVSASAGMSRTEMADLICEIA